MTNLNQNRYNPTFFAKSHRAGPGLMVPSVFCGTDVNALQQPTPLMSPVQVTHISCICSGWAASKERKSHLKSASWRHEPFVVSFFKIWIFQIHMLLSALFLTCRSYRILKILNMFTLSIQQANGTAYQTVMHNSNQYPQACNSKSKLPLNKLGVTLTWIKCI